MTKPLAFVWGVALGIMLAVPVVTWIRDPWIESQAYTRAYEDMKTNKIEEVVRDKYPALWIKWNVPKEKP